MNPVDVLIVGAGPTGLTLGCELARRNISCRIVEKSPELFIGSRAKGLQPRTLEVFDDLARKGLIKAVWPHQIALTPEGLAYETGIADQILHAGGHH